MIVSVFVNTRIPMIIIKTPLITDIAGRNFENFLMYFEKLPIAKDVSRNGIANPNE